MGERVHRRVAHTWSAFTRDRRCSPGWQDDRAYNGANNNTDSITGLQTTENNELEQGTNGPTTAPQQLSTPIMDGIAVALVYFVLS